MRFQTNLSQRPFHNRKGFWLGFFAVMTAVLLMANWTLSQITEADKLSSRLKTSITTKQKNLEILQKTATPSGPLILTEPELRQIQGAADLIEQRKFSWTAMMAEFERQMPDSVRISSITLRTDKSESKSQGLGLSVKIFAKSVEDVTKMMAAADKRGIFRIQPKSQTVAEGEGDIGFDLDVTYLPSQIQRPAVEKKSGENEQFAQKGRS
jgi:Tfp pilus assembly protein PilN